MLMIGALNKARLFDLFIAILFGTSSPNTRVKKDSNIVMMITITLNGISIVAFKRDSLNGPAISDPANAEERNPENVIATWIVESYFVESLVTFLRTKLFLCPSVSILCRSLGVRDTKAISDAAKNPLISTRITMINSMNVIESLL